LFFNCGEAWIKFFKFLFFLIHLLFQPLLHVVLNSVLLKILDTRESGGSVSEALGCQATMTSGISCDGGIDVVDEDDDVRAERKRVQELLKQPEVYLV
jgi:hypothetical protein